MNIKIYPLIAASLLLFACTEKEPQPSPDPGGEEEQNVGYDGKVTRLLTASKGKGLDIVLMGDGFIEEDHENGTYDKAMKTALGHLFSIRPASDLKEYFNVWSVGVVSKNRNLDGNSGLFCKGVNPTDGKSEPAVESYGAKIKSIVIDSTVFCVIINRSANGGWCSHESYKKQKAYAFCPLIPSGPQNQAYKMGLVHETIGHGFAKLADEYTMSGYASVSPSANEIDYLDYIHSCGFDLNVTYSKSEAICPWKEFLSDERYAADNIGFYEGVGYYGKGAYRPTDVNLMNRTSGALVNFSAPDRKIIYDRVIKRGEGRTPSYEEFVAFDRKN